MSKSIKGTQTEKNLLTSSPASHKQECATLILQVWQRKEGYEQISAIFTETADQEKEHANVCLSF